MNKFPRFQLGDIHVSQAAQAELSQAEVAAVIQKHVHGVWEGVRPADIRRNEHAIATHHGLIFSIVPRQQSKGFFYVVTSAEDAMTQLVLDSEF